MINRWQVLLIGNCFFKAKIQVACGPRVGWGAGEGRVENWILTSLIVKPLWILEKKVKMGRLLIQSPAIFTGVRARKSRPLSITDYAGDQLGNGARFLRPLHLLNSIAENFAEIDAKRLDTVPVVKNGRPLRMRKSRFSAPGQQLGFFFLGPFLSDLFLFETLVLRFPAFDPLCPIRVEGVLPLRNRHLVAFPVARSLLLSLRSLGKKIPRTHA